MHSYQTLAVLALAVSTASPALSAPILYASYFSTLRTDLADEGYPPRESQELARANVDAPTSGITSILKTIGTGVGLGALPVALEDFLTGNGTLRRDTVDLNERAIAVRSIFTDLLDSFSESSKSIGEVLGNGLLSGASGEVGSFGASKLLNSTR
jgi:hypothetical protein